MLNPIQDKPPASAYPVTDRITGVLCAGILLGCLLACLGPGEGGEAHAQSKMRRTSPLRPPRPTSGPWRRGGLKS